MISKEDLYGAWKLEAWTIGYSDRDDFSYPYGENPQGLLMYTNDGWMSASICRSDRQPLPEDVNFRKLPDALKAAAGRWDDIRPCVGANLCIAQAWPGQARTVWGDHERFIDVYFTQYDDIYFAGDGCRIDQDGDFWLMGRIDDVVNVSGHRIGTAEVESALVSHDQVAEASAHHRRGALLLGITNGPAPILRYQHLIEIEANLLHLQVLQPGAANRRQQASPVGVGGEQGGFHQGRVRNGIGDIKALLFVATAVDAHRNKLAGAFTVTNQTLGQVDAD